MILNWFGNWKLENDFSLKLKIVHILNLKRLPWYRMDLLANHFISKQISSLLWWQSQRTHFFLCYMWTSWGNDWKSSWKWPSFTGKIIALKRYTEELIFHKYWQYFQTNSKIKYLVYEYNSPLFSSNSFFWQIWISILIEEKQWFNLS